MGGWDGRRRVQITSCSNVTVPCFSLFSDVMFSPEELLAMMFKHCQEIAEAYAEQPVRDVVITVPAFFNQAERRAVNE